MIIDSFPFVSHLLTCSQPGYKQMKVLHQERNTVCFIEFDVSDLTVIVILFFEPAISFSILSFCEQMLIAKSLMDFLGCEQRYNCSPKSAGGCSSKLWSWHKNTISFICLNWFYPVNYLIYF